MAGNTRDVWPGAFDLPGAAPVSQVQVAETVSKKERKSVLLVVAIIVLVVAILAMTFGMVHPNSPVCGFIGFIGGLVLLFYFAVFSIVIYFAPTLNARQRHHRNTNAITVMNIFLGWTFLGWVLALVWSYTDDRRED
jgi:hypothetical protein